MASESPSKAPERVRFGAEVASRFRHFLQIELLTIRKWIDGLSWHHRSFLFLQLAVAVWIVWLWRHLPHAGYAVAILAGVAAAMSVHGEMRGWQKAIWMSLIGSLLLIELRSIRGDRISADIQAKADRQTQDDNFQRVRKKQDDDLKQTADGLATEIRQSSALMSELARTNSIATKSLANITGGSSFAVLERTNPLWTVTNMGDSRLSQLLVTIIDVDKFNQAMKSRSNPKVIDINQIIQLNLNLPVGDIAAHTGRAFTIPSLPPGPVRLSVTFYAMNGYWNENYEARQINNNLEVALRVTRQQGRQLRVLYTNISAAFPKDKGGHPLDDGDKPLW